MIVYKVFEKIGNLLIDDFEDNYKLENNIPIKINCKKKERNTMKFLQTACHSMIKFIHRDKFNKNRTMVVYKYHVWCFEIDEYSNFICGNQGIVHIEKVDKFECKKVTFNEIIKDKIYFDFWWRNEKYEYNYN